MLFVTTGTITRPFYRLVDTINSLPEEILRDTLYQGFTTQLHKVNCKNLYMMNRREIEEIYIKADLIISHAGIGSISSCSFLNKKTLVVARLAEYKEHNNDHQLEILTQLEESPLPNIYPVRNISDLQEAIVKYMKEPVHPGLKHLPYEDLKKKVQEQSLNLLGL